MFCLCNLPLCISQCVLANAVVTCRPRAQHLKTIDVDVLFTLRAHHGLLEQTLLTLVTQGARPLTQH